MNTEQSHVEKLAEQIAWLDTDQIWALAKCLIDNYKVPANLLRADLSFAEQDLDFKD